MPQPMRPPVASCTIKARSKVAVRDSPMLMVKEPSEVPSENCMSHFPTGRHSTRQSRSNGHQHWKRRCTSYRNGYECHTRWRLQKEWLRNQGLLLPNHS